MSPEILVGGVYSGAVYALVALALTIVFQPTRIMNFAQGEAAILGAAVAYQVVTLNGWGWPAAIGLTVAAAVLMGVVMERMVMLPVNLSGSAHAWIIATFAAALIFQSLFNLVYADVDGLRPAPFLNGHLKLAGLRLGGQEVLVVAAAVVVVVGYDAFLRRTLYGRAIRATAHDPRTAVLMGIPVQRIIVLSFVLGTTVAAFAGLLAAPALFIAPSAGLLFTIKGFIATVIGGVGSPWGALAGGLIVGLLDNVLRSYVGGSAGSFAVFAVLALILVIYPAGLFGKPMEAH